MCNVVLLCWCGLVVAVLCCAYVPSVMSVKYVVMYWSDLYCTILTWVLCTPQVQQLHLPESPSYYTCIGQGWELTGVAWHYFCGGEMMDALFMSWLM